MTRETVGVRKVVRIITRLNMGGPARHTVLLDRGLGADGFDTLLVHGAVSTGEASFEQLAERAHIPTFRIPALGRRIRPLDDVRALTTLWRVLRRVRPAVVHTHTTKAGTLGRIVAAVHNALTPRAERAVVVHTFHGHVLEGYFGTGGNLLVRWTERALSRVTDCTVAISDRQRADLVSRFKVASPERTVVIPLGLALDPLLALDRHASEHAGGQGWNEAFAVGYVGRLVPIKRVDRLLRAVALARTRVPVLQLVIVGDGPERRRLEAIAAELGIAEAVAFRGWQEDLAPVYARLDAVAITSANEGTPVALIEAMAAGIPVISTAVGGVPDVVQHEATGLLTAETPESIAEAIVRTIVDPAGARERATRARAFVRERYRDEVLVDRMSALYRELITRKRSLGSENGGKLPQSR